MGSTSADATNHWFAVEGCGAHGYKGLKKALGHLQILVFGAGEEGVLEPITLGYQGMDDCTLCREHNGE